MAACSVSPLPESQYSLSPHDLNSSILDARSCRALYLRNRLLQGAGAFCPLHIDMYFSRAFLCGRDRRLPSENSRIRSSTSVILELLEYARVCSYARVRSSTLERILTHTCTYPRILAHTCAFSCPLIIPAHTRADSSIYSSIYSRIPADTGAYPCILAHTTRYPGPLAAVALCRHSEAFHLPVRQEAGKVGGAVSGQASDTSMTAHTWLQSQMGALEGL